MDQDTKEKPDTNDNDKNIYSPNGDDSKFKVKASNLFKRNKSKFLGGGIAGICGGLIIFAFAGIATYELQTIAKDINNFEDKIVHAGMSSASKSILSKLVCFKMGILCKGKPKEGGNPSNDPASTEGEGLASDEQKFNFNDPQVKSLLESKGITPQFDPEGNFTGFTGPDGSPITPEDILNDTNGVFEDLDKAMPEFSFGQVTSFRDLMFTYANSDFNILKDSPSDTAASAENDIVNADSVGAQGNVAASELSNSISDSEQQTSSSASSATQAAESTALADATDATSALNQSTTDVVNAVEKGASVDAAVNAAKQSFTSDLGTKLAEKGPGTLFAVAQDVCLFDKLVNNQIVKHIPQIISLLIRNGTTTISLASQLTSGKITGQEFSAAMKLFNGSSNPIDKGTNAALPFSASSAWAQATGSKGGIPIDPTSLPTTDGVMKVMQPLNSILNKIPGGRTFCSVSNNPLGGIAIAVGGIIGQGGLDIASFGTAQAVELGLQGAAIGAIYAAVPYITKIMVPVNLMGFQNAVQNMNNTDAGLNLSYNNYYRTNGGMPQTKTQSINNNLVADNFIQNQQSKLSWYQRTFALSNPYSLISKFAVNIPLSVNSTVFDVVNYLQKIPEELLHNFSLLFISPSVLADSNSYPGSPYGTTQYASSNSTINGYDPISNETYLFSNVSYNGKSESRIQMLGDPNKITPSTGDPHNNDLLHCFYDSYTTIYSDATGGGATTFDPSTSPHSDPGADKNCGALGLYNLQDYGDNGDNGPINGMPNNTTIAQIYCHYLNGSASSTCVKSLTSDGQVNNDLQHYRQYLMDISVMNNYMSMMSTSP